jgi:hypothetical protein
MNSKWNRVGGTSGGATPWVLLACAVLGILYFIFQKPKPPAAPPPVIAVATPVPATPTPPPATPEPVIVKATPTPTPPPVAIATPTPPPATPPPLDLATVARTPALWPPQVALVQPVPFPLMLNGRAVGEAKAPAGTPLRVLRVVGQQVEVEYQAARHFIPVAATDLMARALATFRKNGSVIPQTAAAPATPVPVVAAATPEPRTANANPVKIAERLIVDVTRMKRSRTEGGDFDDKRDRIEMKVKISNSDNKLSADKLKGEIYIFGESILDRTAVKLLGAQQFEFSLPPRGTHELVTEEVETMYDTTGARFGHKYEGWVLKVQDSAGQLILAKGSSPTLLKGIEKAPSLTKDKSYDRTTFKEKAEITSRF